MPKMKSRGSVKRRFKVTKSGKVVGSRTGRGHMHASKDAKSRRANRKPIILTGTWATLMRRMMGGK
ncbi:large ribosomal subunit protein bL35 [Engelhardtia mirabilis]|uniref:Large ribosomal subunit protein bL35 n=1 Tax=Engelhardtia mirabilis TaxID=2528011 RepID=A0A518BK59_9BACT|nr:50S ribosomal protein L35 [Planctomycetes bacterium Pla133]QDV01681.1 50S ribosomal protein L35 [Planctomycetes bacterium Pla86]